MVKSRWILRRTRKLSDKFLGKIKMLILYSIFFFQNRTNYEIIWKKYGPIGQATDDNIIRLLRFTCRITTATDTHSEYVIFIDFQLQQWLHEYACKLRYTHTACLVIDNLGVDGWTLLRWKEWEWTLFSPAEGMDQLVAVLNTVKEMLSCSYPCFKNCTSGDSFCWTCC